MDPNESLEVQRIAEAEEEIKMLAKMSVLVIDSVKMLCNGAFVWATVVLLGGFADDLSPIDFWFVSFILVTQFIRQRGSEKADFDERNRQRALRRFDLVRALDDDLTESKWLLKSLFPSKYLFLPSSVNSFIGYFTAGSAASRLSGQKLGSFDYGPYDASVFGSKIVESDNGRPALLMFYIVTVMEGLLQFFSSPIFSKRRNRRLCELFGFKESWGVQVIIAIFYNTCASVRRGNPIEKVLTFALDLFTEEVQQNSHFGVLILSSLARGRGDLGHIMRTETLDAIISKPELVDRLLTIVSSKEPNMEHFRL